MLAHLITRQAMISFDIIVICKINVATEIKNIFMAQLKELLLHNTEIDLRKVFPPAINAVVSLVKEKLEIVTTKNLISG